MCQNFGKRNKIAYHRNVVYTHIGKFSSHIVHIVHIICSADNLFLAYFSIILKQLFLQNSFMAFCTFCHFAHLESHFIGKENSGCISAPILFLIWILGCIVNLGVSLVTRQLKVTWLLTATSPEQRYWLIGRYLILGMDSWVGRGPVC